MHYLQHSCPPVQNLKEMHLTYTFALNSYYMLKLLVCASTLLSEHKYLNLSHTKAL